jgi:hypothetical protein
LGVWLQILTRRQTAVLIACWRIERNCLDKTLLLAVILTWKVRGYLCSLMGIAISPQGDMPKHRVRQIVRTLHVAANQQRF